MENVVLYNFIFIGLAFICSTAAVILGYISSKKTRLLLELKEKHESLIKKYTAALQNIKGFRELEELLYKELDEERPIKFSQLEFRNKLNNQIAEHSTNPSFLNSEIKKYNQ